MCRLFSKFLPAIVFIFILLLLSLHQNLSAQESDYEQFKTLMDKALKKDNSLNVTKLVKENRYHTVRYVNQLLQSYISHFLSNQKENSDIEMNNAKNLAVIYQDNYTSSVLISRTNLYQDWSDEQKSLKAKLDSIRNEGLSQAKKTKYTEANVKFRKALEISVQLQDNYTTSILMENIGKAHRHANKYKAAADTLSLALNLARESENKRSEANILRELGVVTYITGNPEGALKYWQIALEAFEVINEKNLMATTLSHIGIYYKNMGRPEEGLKYYSRALKIHRDVWKEREIGNDLNNIGNIYLDYFADYSKARENFEEALAIKKKYEEVTLQGIILGNIGICFKKQGDYQNALKYFNQAVKLGQEMNQLSTVAKNLSDIGTLYDNVGSYEKSITYYQQALKMIREIGEKKWEIESLINLGATYGNLKQYQDALSQYHSALNLAKQLNSRSYEGTILSNMAGLELELNNNDSALQLYHKSLKITKEIKDKKHQAIVERGLGDYYLLNKKYDSALGNYQNSLEIGLEIDSPEEIWQAYYGIGNVLKKLGDKKEAAKKYKAAINAIESIRNKLSLESLKESFMEEKIEVYQEIILLLLELGRDEEAFDFLERAKALNLLYILSTDRVNITAGISEDLLKKKKRIEWNFQKIYKQLTAEFSKSDDQNLPLINSLQDSLNHMRFQHQEILQEINLKHPSYAQLAGIKKPLTQKEVQAYVLENITLIEYLVTNERTIVFIVTRQNINFEILDISKENLSTYVKNILQPFRDVKTGKITNLVDISYDLKSANGLYQQIFLPIEKYIPPESPIIIVPDDILHYLPFEALVTNIETKAPDKNVIFSRFENADYLVEKYTISYSPSASVLDPKIIFNKQKKSQGLLALGNPYFGAETNIKTKEEEGILDFLSLLIRGTEANSWTFPQLPNTEKEVLEIAKLIEPSVYYIGKEAREERLKTQAGEFKYIHLSTHSVTEEKQPMYSRIVFAQDDDPTEDGFLHAYEVLNLNFDADLVTLSACETGLGKLSHGEGLIGLTRSFMYAGAPSVLVSLWSVDESTVYLMNFFYENLSKGMNKTESIRQAKLKLLHIREDGVSFSHPFLWAPFVLIGNWE